MSTIRPALSHGCMAFAAAVALLPGAIASADDVIVHPTAIHFEPWRLSDAPGASQDPMPDVHGSPGLLFDQSGLIHPDGSSFGYVDRTTVFGDYLDAAPTHIRLHNNPNLGDEPWGPYEGIQDVGWLSVGNVDDLVPPFLAGIDLGATYTVTSMTIWNGNAGEFALWSNDGLEPDAPAGGLDGPNVITPFPFERVQLNPSLSNWLTGTTQADDDGHTASLIKPFVYEFPEPVTTRYLTAHFHGPSGAIAVDHWYLYEIAFGIDAEPLAVALDLGDTPLPVTVPGQLEFADDRDVTPFVLQPGQQISQIEIAMLELTDPNFDFPGVLFWLEDAQGNVVSSKDQYASTGTGLLRGLPALLDPGEYRLVADLIGTDATFASYAYTITTVPEPAALALLGLGGVVMVRRRRR